jgi:hypothetical protein
MNVSTKRLQSDLFFRARTQKGEIGPVPDTHAGSQVSEFTEVRFNYARAGASRSAGICAPIGSGRERWRDPKMPARSETAGVIPTRWFGQK